jgi:hypothetical protein
MVCTVVMLAHPPPAYGRLSSQGELTLFLLSRQFSGRIPGRKGTLTGVFDSWYNIIVHMNVPRVFIQRVGLP